LVVYEKMLTAEAGEDSRTEPVWILPLELVMTIGAELPGAIPDEVV
jgi:hypothetical protein